MSTGDQVLEAITGHKRPDVQAPEGASPELSARFEKAKLDCYEWDRLRDEGHALEYATRPFGPSKEGSSHCQSGSIASGGGNTYCTCDSCF